jgi:hypothetical protein
LAAADARDLGIAACFVFFSSRDFICARASALSDGLYKTKTRAVPTGVPVVATVGTYMAPSTADYGSTPVAMDCNFVIAVAVAEMEGLTYKAVMNLI